MRVSRHRPNAQAAHKHPPLLPPQQGRAPFGCQSRSSSQSTATCELKPTMVEVQSSIWMPKQIIESEHRYL